MATAGADKARDLRGGDLAPMDLDLQLGEAADALLAASGQAFTSTEDARKGWTKKEQNAMKKRRLEAELRSLEMQQRQNQTRASAFLKEEAREQLMTEDLLQLQEAESQLGLPRLEIDHARGLALVGEPPGLDEVSSAELEAFRSIKVAFDEDGSLLHAEPHPALGLSSYVQKALEHQDFAVLPTMVWSRLCEAAAECGAEDFDTRLRRVSSAGLGGA
mmetsp:Transcript_123924/g.174808  ORF Transcript_123924/g.174808 Transcript_123924/m.174808 type:complete len:218 (-) Transcript_123924:198-851(-)